MNIFSNIVSTIKDVASNIAGVFKKPEFQQAAIFPIGAGLTPEQTREAERVVGITPGRTEQSTFTVDTKFGRFTSLPFGAPQSVGLPPQSAGTPTFKGTVPQPKIPIVSPEPFVKASTAPVVTPSGTPSTASELQQIRNEQARRIQEEIASKQAEVLRLQEVARKEAENIRTFGGSGIVTQEGVTVTGGGAQALPGALSGTFRSVGSPEFLALSEEEKKKRLIDLQTELNVLQQSDLSRLSQQQRQDLQTQLSSQSEALTKIQAQEVSPADDLFKMTDEEVNVNATSILNQLLEIQKSGATNIKSFNDQLKQINEDKLNTEKQLKDLELFTIQEIKDIADDPDFSSRLKQRRQFWLTQSPQSPTWLAKIELTNQLQLNETRKQNLVESFNLNRQLTNDQFNQAINIYNTFLKPDQLGLKTDANGNLYSFNYNLLTNKVDKMLIGSGYEKQKQYAEHDIVKLDNGQTISVLTGFDGSRTIVNLGGNVVTSTTPVGSNVFIDAARNFAVSLPKDRGQLFINNVASQTNPLLARDAILSGVITTLPATQADYITGKYDAVKGLEKIEGLLNDYEAKGGNLNLLTGSINNWKNKVGIKGNATLSEAANRIAVEVQQYTRSISGAAFTDRERAAYAAVFPSTTKTLELNLVKTKALKDAFNETIDNRIGLYVGQGNWQKINEQLGSNITGTKDTGTTLESEITFIKNNKSQYPSLTTRESLIEALVKKGVDRATAANNVYTLIPDGTQNW